MDGGAQIVDGGDTMGGLEAKPREAPVSTASFPELASGLVAMSWAEAGPAKVLAGRKRRKCPRVVCHGERRPHSRR